MTIVKSFEYNEDGTLNIIDDAGTKFIDCYLISKEPTVNISNISISVECDVAYDTVACLKKWQKEHD